MYPVRTPALLKPLMKDLIWSMPDDGRSVYLTFDDGPTPGVTDKVLDLLAAYQAKATFFCIGSNAEAHPELMARIRREGHSIGDHTYDHLNGWKNSAFSYFRNVLRSQRITQGTLFRPPYGRITQQQAKVLGSRFDVVMWDVLSGDFDTAIDGAQCARNVLRNWRAGSIIVFHDSLKAEVRLMTALPLVLEQLAECGFVACSLPERGIRPR